MTKELLQQALDALEQYKKYTRGVMIPSTHCTGNAAITALREALAAPMPEPVGQVLSEAQMGIGYDRRMGDVIWWNKPPGPAMLYAAPPAAPAPVVPLTDERLQKHAMRAGDCPPGSMVVLLSSLRRMLSAAPVVPEGDVVVSWNEDGQIVAVTRQDREGRILSVIAESAAPVVREPQDERAAFEAWIRKDSGDLTTFGSGSNMHYRNSAVNNAWTGWQARAHGIGGGGK